MDSITLRAELKRLSEDMDDTGALMKLQHLLTSPDSASIIFRDPMCSRVIERVKDHLSQIIFKANLYQLICVTEQAVAEGRQVNAKSIHDISGNFLWCQKGCTIIFNSTIEKLLRTNLFDLMTRESLRKLSAKFGGELLTDRTPKVISFVLKSADIRLTARCNEAIYTKDGVSRFGILLETRYSRQPLTKVLNSQVTEETFRSPRSPVFPMPEFEISPQFTLPTKRRSSLRKTSPPFVSPNIKQELSFSPSNLSFGDQSLEFSISPYLKMTPEISKKLSGVPSVSEFKG